MSAEPIDQQLAAVVAESQERRVAEKFQTVADTLRKIADDVERDARRPAPTMGGGARTPLSTAAGEILHTVTWGVANLGLDTLTRDAAEADLYRGLADRLAQEVSPTVPE